MKHTPGPWEAMKSEGAFPSYFVLAPDGVVADCIWHKRVSKQNEPEIAANADLIAAAPLLFDALEPFAYLAEVMEEGNVLNFRGVYITYEQAQFAAATIAKAKGEER